MGLIHRLAWISLVEGVAEVTELWLGGTKD